MVLLMHIFIPMLLLRIKRQRCRHDDREEKTKERVYLLFLRGTRHITFPFIIIIEREREERKTFFDVFTTLGVLFQERRFSVKRRKKAKPVRSSSLLSHRVPALIYIVCYNKICKFILIDDDFSLYFLKD